MSERAKKLATLVLTGSGITKQMRQDAFQLLEDQPGKFSLLVVANDAGPSNVESLLGELKVLLEDDVEIKPFTVTSIKPETGGKFRPVKSATYQRLDHASQKDLVS